MTIYRSNPAAAVKLLSRSGRQAKSHHHSLPAITSEVKQLEQTQRLPIVNAVSWYLGLLIDREQAAAEAPEVTKDGLDNLAIVKQAEADQFKQDLG